MFSFLDYLEEKFKVKINSKGEKRLKKVCPDGHKVNSDGQCEKIKSSEKIARRKGHKKASRTKKADAGGRKRALKKSKKAMKKRASRGL